MFSICIEKEDKKKREEKENDNNLIEMQEKEGRKGNKVR